MRHVKDMVTEANEIVDHMPAAEAIALHGQDGVTFVDLRDPRELERDGMIPGAFHCPRGMLEFWIDPESPYAKPQFQTGNRMVFYCASGWRSALSARAAVEMGMANVGVACQPASGKVWARPESMDNAEVKKRAGKYLKLRIVFRFLRRSFSEPPRDQKVDEVSSKSTPDT
jgi:rhodanese-related sulfurtransferase